MNTFHSSIMQRQKISSRTLTPAQYKGLSFVKLENATPNPTTYAPPAQPGKQRQYIVRPNDTLYAIALRELGDGNRWREIKKADGSTFTEAEAKNLRVGMSVYLPVSYQGGTGTPVTPPPTPNPTKVSYPVVSINSVSDTKNSSNNVVRGKSIRISGNSNTTDMKFYVVNGQSERQVGGTLDSLTDGSFTARLNLPNDMPLGNYQVKIVAKNQLGLTNTFYSPSTINVVDDNKVQRDIGKTKGGTERHIEFERVNSPGYIENRPTWIVIHGWNGKAEDSKDLAKAIEEYDGYQVGDQVLTLDWDAARTGLTSLNAAADWIETVGKFAANTLKSWGISSSSINLVGHSLGAYVSYEIAKQLSGIGKLVALDPATTTAGGYPDEKNVDFSKYSQWSWGFYSSLFGSENLTKTADESFKIDFLLANDNEKHGAGRNLWANMLRNRNGSVSQYFGLDDMNSNGKPWYIDNAGYGSDWEAEIKAIDIQEGSGFNWVPQQGGLKEI